MIARVLSAVAIALVLAGCATTDNRVVLREVEQSSVRAARPLAKIAIVTIDGDAVRRKAWDDAFAARLTAAGAAVATRDGLPGAAGIDAGAVTVDGAAVIDAARGAGADAILFVQPPSDKPIVRSGGMYRWMGARSDPDPRTDLDTTPTSVTEVRLYGLDTSKESWRAMVIVSYPSGTAADANDVAASVATGLAKRGYLRTPAR
ncbi:MAG TPA: hypothetical protein PLM09_02015 [Casimicrobiaceae bacterium]|nr:hypothetical protein [Casimicrobiaceae bacterium]